MTDEDVEAELSYAYLHAVAARAGIACQAATRSHDNHGVDATLLLVKDFGPGATLTDVSLHIQLKATTKPPTRKREGHLGYWLDDIGEYNRLRSPSMLIPRLLCVLCLPKESAAWLQHSTEQLTLHNCAYWVSLVGAPDSSNGTGQTIYLPQDQILSPDGLSNLFGRIARLEQLRYVVP